MTTVLISGADGFIASYAAASLRAQGCRLIGIALEKQELPDFHRVYKGLLMQSIERIFQEETIDVFIHLANHTGEDEYAINVEGTRLWAEQAKAQGINCQLFFSSLSAREDSLSSYGRAKFENEKWFVSNDQFVCRFGLVAGNGGLFRRMMSQTKKNILLPLPDAGRINVYITDIEVVSGILEKFVKTGGGYLDRGRIYNFIQPSPVSLKRLMHEFRKQQRNTCFFIPVPAKFLLGVLRVLAAVPFLSTDFSRNNILGMLQNSEALVDSDYAAFGLSGADVSGLVRRALSPPPG